MPVGNIVEAVHNDKNDELLLFKWNSKRYKTMPDTYRKNTKVWEKPAPAKKSAKRS